MKFNHLLYIIDSQTISLCRSGNTVGYAQFCRMDGLTDRPIAGYTNLCPNNIEVDYESIRMATLTMAHELGHVLGFNSEAFRYMRDELGKPRTIRELLSNVTRVWMSAKTTIYRYLTALKTPMILKMAKEYFNCPELDGVELDNNDQMYARGHFEKRLIDNELMTPLLSSRSYISKITLGFFEDTGWYQVNYAGANPMGYGKHLGCDFVMKSCYEYMLIQRRKRQSFYPYCDQIGFSNTLCLKHENAYGFCDLRHYLRPLPLEFQYFEDPRLGSADRFRDYCPAYVPFTGTGNTYSYCNTPEKQSEVQQNKNYMLHYFGASSMCINHDSTRHWEVIRQHEMFDESAPKSSCMNHICSESEGLILIFQDKELVCPIKGKYIDFSLRGKYFNINGSIICPPCRDICKGCKEFVANKPSIQGSRGSGIPPNGYLVFVDATATEPCQSDDLLAYALACQLEFGTDRPVAGYVNMCPTQLSIKPGDVRSSISTFIHEMAHALGFSSTSYAFLREEDGTPRTPRDPQTNLPALGQDSDYIYIASKSTVTKVQRIWVSAVSTTIRTVDAFVLPNVLAEARAHFNCPTMDGMDLENDGGSGTAFVHFEKRITEDELMSGSYSKDSYVSSLTLAYFKDTGWYNVNMSMAQNWRFGKNWGCDFVQLSCYEYMKRQVAKNNPITPYCTKLSSTDIKCLGYDDVFGFCDLQRQKDKVPVENQYFTSIDGVSASELPYYAGGSLLSDRCPVYRYNCSSGGIELLVGKQVTNCPDGESLPINAYDNNINVRGLVLCPSCNGACNLPKLSGNVHFGQLPTAFRIRHPSFVYPDGDPALDQVLGGFSQKLNNKQNGVLTSEDSSDIKDFGINGCDLRSRKSSVATVVDHPLHSCISTPEIYPKVPSSCSDSVTKLAQPLNLSSFNYSDYILPDCPLSSNLVKLYLAKVATSKPTEYKCPNNSSRSRSPQTSVQDDPHRLPECLQIHPPTLASMVMPVNQIIRAHTNQNKSEMKKSDKLGNSLNIYLNGRNAVTDASYSSEYSDGEPWGLPPVCDHTNTGYLSDNHLIEAVSEAKMLNMSKQQLEMRLNIRPGSKSISSSRTQTNSICKECKILYREEFHKSNNDSKNNGRTCEDISF
ncbi:leishmanolysin-2 (M08 family) [Schistosoma mansoni]|uniref:leishmanolysin-2 (M08 family) n=1 Tax=Schistosoma mansoni TaxID=6183 RepID=UPI00022DBF1C|nr:leishmanolysin-2 (M08 family) [Schistosoma mansoni]|eukprot:XP_018651919.1 leishmanolysin-2 (M08 family) [Schistosoma mansoni]